MKIKLINVTGTCDKDRNQTHNLPNTGRMLYPIQSYDEHSLKPCSPWVLIPQWIECLPCVQEVMGSIPVGTKFFFSLPHVHVMLIGLLFTILLLSVIPNVWPVKTFSSILFICILLFMFRRVFQPLNVVDKQYLHIIIKVNLILS